jgi:hypothetical protein
MSKQPINIADLTFDWDALTIGDLITLTVAAENNKLVGIFAVIDKCAVGGINHLPMRLYEPVINRFAAE